MEGSGGRGGSSADDVGGGGGRGIVMAEQLSSMESNSITMGGPGD